LINPSLTTTTTIFRAVAPIFQIFNRFAVDQRLKAALFQRDFDLVGKKTISSRE
jgi:hypothetical protein